MKSFTTLLISLILFTNLSAQKKNHFYLSTNNTWYPGTSIKRFQPADQYGIGFKRSIVRRVCIDLYFSQWYTRSRERYAYYRFERSIFNKACENKIEYRSNYRFIDFSVSYVLFNKQKIGNLSVQLGAGRVWGTNRWIDTIIVSTVPPFDNLSVQGHNENAAYFGIIPGLVYDYYLWRRRVNLGINVKARRYFSGAQRFVQCDLGFQVGYNF